MTLASPCTCWPCPRGVLQQLQQPPSLQGPHLQRAQSSQRRRPGLAKGTVLSQLLLKSWKLVTSRRQMGSPYGGPTIYRTVAAWKPLDSRPSAAKARIFVLTAARWVTSFRIARLLRGKKPNTDSVMQLHWLLATTVQTEQRRIWCNPGIVPQRTRCLATVSQVLAEQLQKGQRCFKTCCFLKFLLALPVRQWRLEKLTSEE